MYYQRVLDVMAPMRMETRVARIVGPIKVVAFSSSSLSSSSS